MKTALIFCAVFVAGLASSLWFADRLARLSLEAYEKERELMAFALDQTQSSKLALETAATSVEMLVRGETAPLLELHCFMLEMFLSQLMPERARDEKWREALMETRDRAIRALETARSRGACLTPGFTQPSAMPPAGEPER